MRSKSIVLLALALGCGLVASIGISQVMEARSKSVDQGDRQPVFVAMADINPNEELTAQNIKLEEWPKNIIPAGALTKLEEVEGKRVRMKLYVGEPILSSKLVGATEAVGAAKDIPAGYRVAHVKVDPTTGSSNLILPGDRVDVVVFRNPNNNLNATAAKIVLQDIKVFAVDTHTETEFTKTKNEQSEPMSAKTIALLVTPQQATILHAATEMGGSVRLVLRNPEDNVHVTDQGATIGDIFGPDQPANRDAERTGNKEGGNMAAWLNSQQEKSPPTPPRPSDALPASYGGGKRMIVMMGSQLTTVDIPDDGELPTNQPRSESSNSAGSSDQQTTDSIDGGLPLPPSDPNQSNEPNDEIPNE